MLEDQPLQSDANTGDKIIPETAENPQSPEQRAEAAWSKFMDDMEAKIPQTGKYFLDLGGKDTNKDNRAFILIKPFHDLKEDTVRYVVISRKGARGASQKAVENDVVLKNALNNVKRGLHQGEIFAKGMKVNRHYSLTPSLDFEQTGRRISMDSDIEEETVKRVIQESMELVKTTATDAQVKKAESLQKFLDTLPSRETPPPTSPSNPPSANP